MKDKAIRADDALFLKQFSKFLKTHASCGHKKAIDEMLSHPEVCVFDLMNNISNTKMHVFATYANV